MPTTPTTVTALLPQPLQPITELTGMPVKVGGVIIGKVTAAAPTPDGRTLLTLEITQAAQPLPTEPGTVIDALVTPGFDSSLARRSRLRRSPAGSDYQWEADVLLGGCRWFADHELSDVSEVPSPAHPASAPSTDAGPIVEEV